MPTSRSLVLLHRLRVDVGQRVDQVVRDLTAAWVDGWDRVGWAWQSAVADILERVADGEPVPEYLLREAEALLRAMHTTQAAMTALTGTATALQVTAAADVVAMTATAEPGIIAAQMPRKTAWARIRRYRERIAPSQLEQILQRCTEQIHAAHWPLAGDAVEAMRRALTKAAAAGLNPTRAARDMLRLVEGEFHGGLARAVTIARTELLDAGRATSAAVHAANADVVQSWVWIASLSHRTCPGCWAMHGTEHPLTEAGPNDHHCGRCARLPKVRPWRDLGIDLDELPDMVPDAATAFGKLPRVDQLAVMGPGRLALLEGGVIRIGDLAELRGNGQWRDSWAPRPVSDLQRVADRRARH